MSGPGAVPEIPGPLGQRPERLRSRRLRAAWVRGVATVSAILLGVAQRCVDGALALAGLVVLLPILLPRALAAYARTGRVLERTTLIGRFRTPFERLSFAGEQPGRSLPVLLNVLRGDLAFAGPRPLTPAEAAAVPPDAAVRFDVRPGLVSIHTLRRRTGVAYEAEHDLDRELVYDQSLQKNLGLVARAVPAAMLGGGAPRPAPPTLEFFGVTVVNTTMDEAVEWIMEHAAGSAPALLAFVNPDCLNIAYGNEAYREVLRTAHRVLPDGIGIHLGCQVLGTRLLANVNGTDLFPRLCERLAGTERSIYLLGARPGIAAAAAAAMQARCPGLRVAGTRDGYFTPDEEAAVVEGINASGASVLLVAFGVPKQELWLAAHHAQLRPAVRMGVGGLFDFYSGRIARAPVWMREIGLEWVWRLLQEPGRMWRRYLVGNPLFLYRVWRQARTTPPADGGNGR